MGTTKFIPPVIYILLFLWCTSLFLHHSIPSRVYHLSSVSFLLIAHYTFTPSTYLYSDCNLKTFPSSPKRPRNIPLSQSFTQLGYIYVQWFTLQMTTFWSCSAFFSKDPRKRIYLSWRNFFLLQSNVLLYGSKTFFFWNIIDTDREKCHKIAALLKKMAVLLLMSHSRSICDQLHGGI